MVAEIAVFLQCLARVAMVFLAAFLATSLLGADVGTVSIVIALTLSVAVVFLTIKTKLPIYRQFEPHRARRLLIFCTVSAVGWGVFFVKATGWF
ncbi:MULTISPECIES: hypothetical protein [unclassified Polaromonas]|uniref:hypothetical protein n=1 Tax=unclassified Polaromonas TaxID=2638319 RepID=UPI00129E3119|nr:MULTISPECIES: hypothetical protein [unclassified Polaromonas]QGJ20115.1 hypothetical protein F7R28_18125 [Polaromonas sp. Pch-P]